MRRDGIKRKNNAESISAQKAFTCEIKFSVFSLALALFLSFAIASNRTAFNLTNRCLKNENYSYSGTNSPLWVGGWDRHEQYSYEILCYADLSGLNGKIIDSVLFKYNISSINTGGATSNFYARVWEQDKGAYNASAVYNTFALSAWTNKVADDTLPYTASPGWYTMNKATGFKNLIQTFANQTNTNDGFIFGGSSELYNYYWIVSACSLVVWYANPGSEITVLSGSDTGAHVPMDPYYGYSYSQCIYLQSEINAGGAVYIDTILFNFNGNSAFTDTVVVYMGNTGKSTFSSTTDWVSTGSMTQVYSGPYSVSASPGWYMIKLASPFLYNNTDNLVIAVDENGNGYHTNADEFFAGDVGANRSLHYYNDVTNPNPSSPLAGVLSTKCANLKIKVQPAGGPPENYGDWLYSSNFYLNTTQTGANIPGNVLKFPVMIRLNSANFNFGQAKTDGTDIRFSKSNGAHLYYERERYDNAGQKAEFWVLVDTVYGNNNTQYIKMHWGNAGAADSSKPAQVFKTGAGYDHAGVWHLDNFMDATPNANHGVNYGSIDTIGMIGKAKRFDGVDDSLYTPGNSSINNLDNATYEAWIYPKTWGESGMGRIYDRGMGPLSLFLDTVTSKGGIAFKRNRSITNTEVRTGDKTVALNRWIHVAAVMNNTTTAKIFLNGIEAPYKMQTPGSGTLVSDAVYPLTIGNAGGGTRTFDGFIDELRMSNIGRSPDWIKLSYQNQRAKNTLLYGADTTPPDNDMNLIVTGIGSDKVRLSWNPSAIDSSDAYCVGIWYKTVDYPDSAYDPSAVLAGIFPLADTIDTVYGLTQNSTYYFILVARDGDGNWSDTAFSASKTATTGSVGVKTWTGSADNNWSNASNWSPASVPTPTDSVIFNNTANACMLGSGVTVKAITFTSGYTGAFNFNTFKMTVNGNADFSIAPAGDIMFSGGSSVLEMNVNASHTVTPPSADTLPGIMKIGSGTLSIAANRLYCDSITVAEGTFNAGSAGAHVMKGVKVLNTATFTGSTSTISVGGNIEIMSVTAAFNAPSDTLSIGKGFNNSAGGAFNASGGAVVLFKASTGGNMISPGGVNLGNVLFKGAGGSWSLNGNLNADSVTAAQGSLNCGSFLIHTIGNFKSMTPGGSFSFPTCSLTISKNADFSKVTSLTAGRLCFNGSGNQNFIPRSMINFPHITKNGSGTLFVVDSSLNVDTLIINDGIFNANNFNLRVFKGFALNNTGIFTGSGSRVLIDSSVHIGSASAVFNAPSDTLYIGRGFFNNAGGTFNKAAGGIVVFNATTGGNSIYPGSLNMGHVLFNGTGGSWTLNGGLYADTLKIRQGFLNAGSSPHIVGSFISTTPGGSFDFSTCSLNVSINADFSQLTTINHGSGKINFMGAGTQVLSPRSNDTLPEVLHHGSGTLQLATNTLFATGFYQVNGILNLNSRNIKITGGGHFEIANGTSATIQNLAGDTISAEGNVFLSGQNGNPLNLDPGSAWRLIAGGSTLTANYATIGNCNAAGGPWGKATNSTDASGNTRWDFSAPASAVTTPVDSSYVNALGSIAGTATDGAGSGVKQVKITITRESDGNYWDGLSTWVVPETLLTVSGTTGWTYSSPPAWTTGSYRIRSIATDSVNFTQPGPDTCFFTYDNTPPTVPSSTITSPNGGETWTAGSGQTITWNSAGIIDTRLGNNPVTLAYSTDGGVTFSNTIVTGITNSGTYAWTLPDIKSSTVRVRIIVTDSVNNTAMDTSNANFAIKPTLTVTAPNAALTWTAGSSQNITWISTGTTITAVKLAYSTDGGITYPNIISASETNDSTYSWTVPTVTGNQFRVRVSDAADTTIFDVSDADFTINNRPVAGYAADNVIPADQVVQATDGSGLITISFRLKDPDADLCTLHTFQYSVDNGSTWNAPTNGDASASLEAGWANNSAADYTSATDWAGTVHSFTFNTKHADVTGLSGVDQSDVMIRFTANDGTLNSAAPGTSQAFGVDNAAPTGLAPFSVSTYTTTSATLIWSTAADANFNHYEIWYGTNQTDVTNRAASEWDNTDDANLASAITATSMITGLASGTTYWFKIWAVDQYGNEMTVAEVSQAINTAPQITGLGSSANISANQTTDGTQNVLVDYEVSDAEQASVSISLEYYNGSAWSAATTTSGDAGASIDATSSATDRQITWNVGTDITSAEVNNYNARIIADDGEGSYNADTLGLGMDSLIIDTKSPISLASLNVDNYSANTCTLSWTAATDANFDHYEIWFGTNQTDVQNRAAGEWDDVDDANLASAATSTTTITGLSSGSTYWFKIWAIDQYGNEMTVAEASQSLNLAPTDITLSNDMVGENQASGTTVGNFSSTDPNGGDTHTYTLVSGTGGADNGSFSIVGDALRTAEMFNYEVKNSYSIRVRTTDNGTGNLYYEEPFTITITNENEAPTATADNYSVSEDGSLNESVGTGVLSNDTDPESSPLTATLVADVTNGTLTLNSDGSFSYTPDANYYGSDGFTYQANDGSVNSNTATVSITVNAANDTPSDMALSDTAVIDGSGPGTVIGMFSTTDIDGSDTHAYSLVTGTGSTDNGSFSIDGDSLKLGTTVDYEVQNTYSIRMRTTDDGTGNLWYEKVFIITVSDSNDAPTDIAISGTAVNENEPAGTVIGIFMSTDPDTGNVHTYTFVSGPGDTDNASFIITDDTLKSGAMFNFEAKSSYTIRIRTTDNGTPALWYEEAFAIAVNDVNDSPDATADNYTVSEDAVLTITAPGVLSNDADPEAGPLTAVLVSTASHGTLTLNSNGSFSYTPDTNFSGADTFTYQANDGSLNSGITTVSMSVTAVNDTPVVVPDAYTVNEDVILNIAAPGVLSNDSDIDGNPLTAVQVSAPASGSLTLNSNGSFTYIPGSHFSGSDNFTYYATDGTLNSGAAAVSITVNPINDPPVITCSSGNSTFTEGDTANSIDSGISVGDVDNSNFSSATVSISANFSSSQDSLVFTSQNGITGSFNTGTGVLSLAGSATIANYQTALRSIKYKNSSETPSALQRTVSFIVNDGAVNSAAASRNITVVAVNDAPVLTGSGGSITFIENDTARSIDNGITVIDADNTALFSAAVTIVTNYTTPQDTLIFVNQNGITGSFNPGTAELSLSGSATVANYQTALRSVKYQNKSDNPNAALRGVSIVVNDGVANSNTVARDISVTPVNDAPLAAGDSYTMNQKDTLAIAAPGILSNDIDAEGATLTPTVITNVANGTLALITNGSFQYIPGTDYCGTDTFSYRVSDGTLNSNTANVIITVNDTIPPQAASLAPADNAIGVGLNDSFTIVFDEKVFTGSGSITIARSADLSVFETIAVTSGSVTGNGTNTITINPVNSFSSKTGYYILIPATCFRDSSNNYFAGYTSDSHWNFTTIDVITDVPVLTMPVANDTIDTVFTVAFTLPEKPLAGSIKMTFTRTGGSVDPHAPHIVTFAGSFESAGLHSTSLWGRDLSASAYVSSVNTSPADSLVDDARYTVTISYQDSAGNPVAQAENNSIMYNSQDPALELLSATYIQGSDKLKLVFSAALVSSHIQASNRVGLYMYNSAADSLFLTTPWACSFGQQQDTVYVTVSPAQAFIIESWPQADTMLAVYVAANTFGNGNLSNILIGYSLGYHVHYIKDMEPPAPVTALTVSAQNCSTMTVGWTPSTSTDAKQVKVCASAVSMPSGQNAGEYFQTVVPTVSSVTLTGLPKHGAVIYAAAFVADNAGNWSALSTGSCGSIRLPDGVPPENSILATLSNIGDSAVAVVFDIADSLQYKEAGIYFSLSSVSPNLDTASDITLGFHDTVFIMQGIVKPGTWYAAWAPFDSAGNIGAQKNSSVFIKNSAPIITMALQHALTEDSVWTIKNCARDVNNDPLQLHCIHAPAALSVSNTTVSITWKPRNSDVGTHSFGVYAADSLLHSDTVTVTLVVHNRNDAPVILSAAFPDTVYEDSAMTATVLVSDPDKNDTLGMTVSPAVPWLRVTATAPDTADSVWRFELSGKPGDTDTGAVQFTVSVADKSGAAASSAADMYVVNTNDNPVTFIVKKEKLYGAVKYAVGGIDDFDTIFTCHATFDCISDSTDTVQASTNTTGVFAYYPLADGRYLFTCYVEDKGGLVDPSPVADTFEIKGVLTHTWKDTGVWHMISAPVTAHSAEPLQSAGTILHWDESKAADGLYKYYIRSSHIQQLSAGKSYWTKQDSAATLTLHRDSLCSGPLIINLHKTEYGWNQIASPYPYPVKWNKDLTLWKWNPQIRDFEESEGVLYPWEGYWVLADNPDTALLSPEPYFLTRAYSKRSKTCFADKAEWTFCIELTSNINRDADNLFGVSKHAKDGYDRLDRPEPPRMGREPYLFFAHPEWKKSINEFASDIRHTWNDRENVFQIGISPCTKEVTALNLDISGYTSEMPVYLFVNTGTDVVAYKQGKSITMTPSDQVQYRTVFATGDRDFLNRLPTRFVMNNPYPNPCRPATTIRYTLPYRWENNGWLNAEPYKVKLVIYDARGREVCELVNRKQEPGHYRVLWRGKGDTGRMVASGFYFARLEAGKYSSVKKIIAIR